MVRVWGVLEQVLQRHEHHLSKADRAMRITRVDLQQHPQEGLLIGVRYKESLLPEVRRPTPPSCLLPGLLPRSGAERLSASLGLRRGPPCQALCLRQGWRSVGADGRATVPCARMPGITLPRDVDRRAHRRVAGAGRERE